MSQKPEKIEVVISDFRKFVSFFLSTNGATIAIGLIGIIVSVAIAWTQIAYDQDLRDSETNADIIQDCQNKIDDFSESVINDIKEGEFISVSIKGSGISTQYYEMCKSAGIELDVYFNAVLNASVPAQIDQRNAKIAETVEEFQREFGVALGIPGKQTAEDDFKTESLIDSGQFETSN